MFLETIAGLDTVSVVFLFVSLGIALGFEFVNGFHDAANAVATVIYTKSMKPNHSVILSGIFNFLGVYVGGIAVAYAIVHLLPVELLVSVNTHRGLAMIFAVLVAAIIWNLGTWYLGLPASSSHTLIGSIIGVGLANAISSGVSMAASVNWDKVSSVGLSLLISPLLGFGLAALLLVLSKKFVRGEALRSLNQAPDGDKPPPFWIRFLLIGTCTGVSFAHGSNDGQKGVGLIMLILIGIMPAAYALDYQTNEAELADVVDAAERIEKAIVDHPDLYRQAVEHGMRKIPSDPERAYPVECGVHRALESARDLQAMLADKESVAEIPTGDRWKIRTDILCLDDAISDALLLPLTSNQDESLRLWRSQLRLPTEYAPEWVLLAVALALGIGTMIGWKRIVVTIGEKIGKTRMTYAQGAAAQTTAALTIGVADILGLPVSTTHVLSSGVAGTMAVGKGGLQASTLKSIALAWVLTLPCAVILAAALFYAFTALS